MVYKRTWIGDLYERDKPRFLRELMEEIDRVDGNMVRLAHALNTTRRYLYRIIHRDGDMLWPAIDRARIRALETNRCPHPRSSPHSSKPPPA